MQVLQAPLLQIKADMRKSFKLLIFVALVSTILSCGGKKESKVESKTPEDPRMDMTMARSGEDTLQIISRAKEYRDNVVSDTIDQALASI